MEITAKDVVAAKYKELGPTSVNEKKVIALLVVILLALVLEPYHKINAAWILGVAVNLILTPLAAMASFTVPIAQMAAQAGINLVPVFYAYMQGLDQYILPYEYAVLLFVFSFGYISFKNMVKVMEIKMFLNLIFIVELLIHFGK